MKAKCINEPRGEHGLEGYILGEAYKTEWTGDWYKIYPESDYWEKCSKHIFKKYFKRIKE